MIRDNLLKLNVSVYENCETCEGTGEVDVLYSDITCEMGSNEAMRRAGEVHHTEVCPDCVGYE